MKSCSVHAPIPVTRSGVRFDVNETPHGPAHAVFVSLIATIHPPCSGRPGAAFTANGDRLGRCGGVYDRLLSSPGFRAFKVGVCFDRQVLEEVPVEAHDQRVHRVVTEAGWLQRPDFVKKITPRRSEEAKQGKV